jgi:hypothetical protein
MCALSRKGIALPHSKRRSRVWPVSQRTVIWTSLVSDRCYSQHPLSSYETMLPKSNPNDLGGKRPSAHIMMRVALCKRRKTCLETFVFCRHSWLIHSKETEYATYYPTHFLG